MREMKKALIAASFLALLAGCGQQTAETTTPPQTPPPVQSVAPSQTPTPEPTQEQLVIPDPISYTGSGDDVISISPFDGVYVFRISGNQGGNHFAVKGYDSTGNSTELLVNTTDPYSGITLDPSQSTSTLEISSTGSWNIDLVSIYEMPTISQGQQVSGTGDAVLQVLSYGTTASITGNDVSAHFAVKSYGTKGNDLMVNTTDPYSGKVMLKDDPIILQIMSEGDWSITFD